MVAKWLQFLPPFYFQWQFVGKIRKSMKNKKVFVNCDHVIGDNIKIQIDELCFYGSVRFKSQLIRFQPNNSPPKILIPTSCVKPFKELCFHTFALIDLVVFHGRFVNISIYSSKNLSS
ncbi:hypothetical protein HanPI659440_Chr08g0304371 [Helianthus annuus]|nr:hypothetical protein HanPI659440_Chr08g0304371 [Helianthus annuus]